MTIGERIRRAIERRPGLTQAEVARRAGLQETTISEIVTGLTKSPGIDTIQKILKAIGASHAEVFDEPQLQLSPEDADVASRFHEWLGHVLKNNATQRELKPRGGPATDVRDLPSDLAGDVENAGDRIPPNYQRLGARRAFRVKTDAMIGVGILEGSVIFVLPTIERSNADGKMIICRLGSRLFLRKLDLRGGRVVLEAENFRYEPIEVAPDDTFEMIGIVVTPP